MVPAVPVPENSGIRTPIDLKLKPKWRFDAKGGAFESEAGEQFSPRDDLPKGAEIVYKVPSLVKADVKNLSKHERDLRRYMQVILPADESPAEYVAAVRAWPCVAEAQVAPTISLPGQM